MEAPREPLRPVGEVLGAGAITGAIAGLAAGAIDALWSWGPAAQFVPAIAGRLRFVLFVSALHLAVGALAGFLLAGILLALSRASRLGDVLRHGWRHHLAERARDPGAAVGGLAHVLVGLPVAGLALYLAYRLAVPYVTNRHEMGLVVIVVMGATLGALAVAAPVIFLLARAAELAIAPLARKLPHLASPWAPAVATGVLIAAGVLVWVAMTWSTTRLLPLRGPAIVGLGLALAAPAARPGLALVVWIDGRRRRTRHLVWFGGPILLFVLVLVLGGSAQVIKASSSYTGLSGPLARTVRAAFDWDRDGYSRFLGGGDCDDGDRTVHPGAPEIPDDGIDQNCVGGDPSATRTVDPHFVAVPPGVAPGFRVLVITIDTVRADHFGMYGYARPTTPELDALARDAIVFDNGWAHAPSTRYSMPAILTGRLPLDVRYDHAHPGWPGLLPSAHTIGESFQELGFTTGAITSYEYFTRTRHMDQGFTEYDNANASKHGGVAGAGPERTRGSSSKEQTDKAIQFVDRHANDRWFLWVHYYDPHADYEAHRQPPPFGDDEVALYDGELLYTDAHIGRLIDHLRSKGLYDHTVIVVTGDHGEGFGEHGVTRHGYHLYAAQTKVPYVIRVPGLAPRHATTPAGHIDLVPTLVNLAGGKPDDEMMGRSLVDVLAGADLDRTVFQQLSYEGNHEMRAAASRQCHVIYNVSPDTSWEVYRIDRDPDETEDLANHDECTDTREALERWYDVEQIPVGAAEALLSARPPLASPIDADLGDAVRLLACEAPATARPGDTITLTWTFEARGLVDPGWKLFAHIDGPGGQFVNADHAPARPFEWWKPGQVIRYTTQVALPRTLRGTFTVGVGLYKSDEKGQPRARVTSPRAPLASGRGTVTNNKVTCTTFEVTPAPAPAPVPPATAASSTPAAGSGVPR